MQNKITTSWVFFIIAQLIISAYQLANPAFSVKGSSEYYLFLYFFLIVASLIVLIGFFSNFKRIKTQPAKTRILRFIESISSIIFLLSVLNNNIQAYFE